MKFLKLGYTGYGDGDGIIDFTNTAGTMTVLAGVSARALGDLLCAALHGDVDGKLQPKAKVYLDFEHAELIYRIEREFDENEKTHMLALILEDGANDRFEGQEAQDLIYEFLPIDAKAFREYIVINRSGFTESFIQGDSNERTKFIDQCIFNLSGTTDSATRMASYQDQAKAIQSEIDSITPTTPEDVEASLKEIDNLEISIAELKVAAEELAKNCEVPEDNEGAEEYSKALERSHGLKDLEAELEKDAEALKEYESVVVISEKYLEFSKVSNELKERSEEIELIKKARDEAKTNSENVKQEAEDFAQSIAKQEALIKETGSRFQSSLLLYSQDPKSSNAPDVVNEYFAQTITQKNKLLDERKIAEEEKSELTNSIKALILKKNEINCTADYRKSVTECAILENSAKILEDELISVNSNLETLKKEKSDLETSIQAYEEKINEISYLNDELLDDAGVSENFTSIFNVYTEEFRKVNTLTAKYFEVKTLDDERKNVNEKIVSALASVEKYKEKLKLAIDNKEKLLLAGEKTEIRLKLLQAKRAEYEGYNMMRSISDTLLYGSHCPVCDGYITYKQELSLKDTRALDAQIETQKAEDEKNKATILELTAVIGQREVAVRVGNQYVDSLNASLKEITAKIDKILSEYPEITTVESLKAYFVDKLSKLDDLARITNEYSINEIELKSAKDIYSEEVSRLNLLDEEIIPKVRERIEKIISSQDQIKADYNNLKSILNGEDGSEVLKKILLSAREVETIDEELELQREKLIKINEKIEELNELISALDSINTSAEIDGQSLTYTQAVIKALADELLYIQGDERDNPFDYDALVSDLKVLLEKASEADNKYKEIEKALEEAEKELNTIASQNEELFTSCMESFSKYSIENEDDALRLIKETPNVAAYRDKKDKYEVEAAEIEKAIEEGEKKMLARADLEAAASEALANLKEVNEKIEEYEEALNNTKLELEARRDRIQKLEPLTVKIAKVNKLISNLEKVSKSATANEVTASDFADTIFNFADANAASWSTDRYALKSTDTGIDLINVEKNDIVDPIKYTDEEKSILELSVTIAYGDAMEALLGIKVQRALVLYDSEIQNESVKVLMKALDGKDVLVVVEDLDSAHMLRNVLYDVTNN
ncbi:MAG: hypothetical protein LBF12_01075 [Christensenellaceae bacterium]|jgi:DNA repair exonuclease SbcCD ATPase subunit|nr:hypothetical protein [Christensenellaceae bacterium]